MVVCQADETKVRDKLQAEKLWASKRVSEEKKKGPVSQKEKGLQCHEHKHSATVQVAGGMLMRNDDSISRTHHYIFNKFLDGSTYHNRTKNQ